MDDKILWLVDEAQALNSKIFSLPRLLILLSLENIGPDGALYRDIKASLRLGDGVLFSNLKALKSMGYIGEKAVKLEGKNMTTFSITQDGKESLDAVKIWFGNLLKDQGE